MQYDAWDYRLLEQSENEGMYSRQETRVHYSWEIAAQEATRELRPCTYPLALNRDICAESKMTDAELADRRAVADRFLSRTPFERA